MYSGALSGSMWCSAASCLACLSRSSFSTASFRPCWLSELFAWRSNHMISRLMPLIDAVLESLSVSTILANLRSSSRSLTRMACLAFSLSFSSLKGECLLRRFCYAVPRAAATPFRGWLIRADAATVRPTRGARAPLLA